MARFKHVSLSLLAWLSFQFACSLIVSNVGPRSEEHPLVPSRDLRPTLSVSAKALIGYEYGAVQCEENSELQEALLEEIQESSYFDLAAEPDRSQIELEACFHEWNDAENMEGPLIISGLTLGLIPTWYSRELILDVTARTRNGRTSEYIETDSYTAINWLPLAPFSLYWGSSRVFANVARQQFRRVLAQMRALPSNCTSLGPMPPTDIENLVRSGADFIMVTKAAGGRPYDGLGEAFSCPH